METQQNFKHADSGGVIRDGKRNWILGYNRFLGKCSVAVAKFWGILDGLLLLQKQGYDDVTFHYDNLEIVIAITKEEKWLLRHVLREANKIANALVKMALSNDEILHMFDDPIEIQEVLQKESTRSNLDMSTPM
ncbi:hypothetical protein Godav_020707 [Gossypium davidsonii]|uniref:RNase H type-1 domain-containing protein n=1 Tax=Gossypium davidsonii TaxID=34287 RepID=A0A7J8R4H9_GOSDV|nr:hypothetical protein [Gossypium davidsonii]